MRARWRFDLPIALLATLSMHLQYLFSGRLFGDLGDARLTVVSYEHWYGFLTGSQSLTGGLFFHPAKSIVGLTDAFLVPGVVHSVFRAVGLGMLGSWALTNFVLIFVGMLGAARVARWLVSEPLAAALLVLAFANAYAFDSQLNHLQTLGYLAAFWLLIWARTAADPQESRRRRLAALFGLGYGIPLVALTSWYAFALGSIVGLALLIFGAVRGSRRMHLRAVRIDWHLLLGLVPSLGLWGLWIVIYQPAFGSLTRHAWTENAFYLPHPTDLLNASLGGWGYEPALYRVLGIGGHYTRERAMGLPFLLALATLVALAELIGHRRKYPSAQRNWLLATLGVAIGSDLIMVIVPNGFSVWYFIRSIIPGAESLRAPFRIAIYANWLLLGGVAWVVFRRIPKFAALVIFLLLFDSWRVTPASFTAGQFVPTTFASISSQLAGCDSFYLRPDPAKSSSRQQVDAMIIATMAGVPTVNGYSGNFPAGWPAGYHGYWGPVPDDALRTWLKANNRHEVLCIFDATGHETAKLTT